MPTSTALEVRPARVEIDSSELDLLVRQHKAVKVVQDLGVNTDSLVLQIEAMIHGGIYSLSIADAVDANDIILTGYGIVHALDEDVVYGTMVIRATRTHDGALYSCPQKAIMFDENSDDREHYTQPWLDAVRKLLT